MKLRYSLLTLQGILLAASLQAGTIVSTVRGSNTGLGQINFQPGTNVSEFMVFGNSGPYADYGDSISPTITGDGQLVSGAGTYEATYFTWNGGDPGTTGGASGSTYNVDPGVVEALSSGYGTTPWTTATLTITAPSSAFTADFFMHDYYASADLTVELNGAVLSSYNDIMSSSGSRNTDFLYDESISGVNAGDTLTFTFGGLSNLGSPWSNIDIMAASVDYVLPPSINNLTSTTMDNTAATPEPATFALTGLCGAALLLFRKRKTN